MRELCGKDVHDKDEHLDTYLEDVTARELCGENIHNKDEHGDQNTGQSWGNYIIHIYFTIFMVVFAIF